MKKKNGTPVTVVLLLGLVVAYFVFSTPSTVAAKYSKVKLPYGTKTTKLAGAGEAKDVQRASYRLPAKSVPAFMARYQFEPLPLGPAAGPASGFGPGPGPASGFSPGPGAAAGFGGAPASGMYRLEGGKGRVSWLYVLDSAGSVLVEEVRRTPLGGPRP